MANMQWALHSPRVPWVGTIKGRGTSRRLEVCALAQPSKVQSLGRSIQGRSAAANVSEVETVTDKKTSGSLQSDFEVDEVLAKELQDNGKGSYFFLFRVKS
jgi:hypothetical protein